MNLKKNKFLNYKDYYLIWKIPTYMEMLRENDQKGKNLLIWNCHVTIFKKDAYKCNKKQLQNHSLLFIH